MCATAQVPSTPSQMSSVIKNVLNLTAGTMNTPAASANAILVGFVLTSSVMIVTS